MMAAFEKPGEGVKVAHLLVQFECDSKHWFSRRTPRFQHFCPLALWETKLVYVPAGKKSQKIMPRTRFERVTCRTSVYRSPN